jgi:hypothetical protein
MFPPEGPELAGIRYDERRTPLLELAQILTEQTEGRFQIERTGEWTTLLTAEGEHAATISLGGVFEGRAAQLDLGVVKLDDSYALFSGYCFAAALFDRFRSLVQELVRGDVHFLGVRRRRFDYCAPTGWRLRARGYVDQWSPIGDDAVKLTVWAALPSARVSIDAFIAQLELEPSTQHTKLRAAHELTGVALIARGAGLRRAFIFECDRYIYPIHLSVSDGDPAPHEATLLDVVRSLVPVPRPAPAENRGACFEHWAE